MNVRSHRSRRFIATCAALIMTVAALTGCEGPFASETDTDADPSGTVALLLPETRTARYESQDKPMFEQALMELCPRCELLYSNAEGDGDLQMTQAATALDNGARVLVLDPVDGRSATTIAQRAKERGARVIAYDRMIRDADIDAFISIDGRRVGMLQAQSLLDRIKATGATGKVVMINGSPSDTNAAVLKDAAHSVLDGTVAIGREYDTPDWNPDEARREMTEAIDALGLAGISGVYAANDGMASGAIAALRLANVTQLPPVTGQDAELAAIQRIVAGEQYMTVYKSIRDQAMSAAEVTIDLLRNRHITGTTVAMKNGYKDVPSKISAPVAVTQQNIASTVVRDGMWTVAQICTDQYRKTCSAIGLQ